MVCNSKEEKQIETNSEQHSMTYLKDKQNIKTLKIFELQFVIFMFKISLGNSFKKTIYVS